MEANNNMRAPVPFNRGAVSVILGTKRYTSRVRQFKEQKQFICFDAANHPLSMKVYPIKITEHCKHKRENRFEIFKKKNPYWFDCSLKMKAFICR